MAVSSAGRLFSPALRAATLRPLASRPANSPRAAQPCSHSPYAPVTPAPRRPYTTVYMARLKTTTFHGAARRTRRLPMLPLRAATTHTTNAAAPTTALSGTCRGSARKAPASSRGVTSHPVLNRPHERTALPGLGRSASAYRRGRVRPYTSSSTSRQAATTARFTGSMVRAYGPNPM